MNTFLYVFSVAFQLAGAETLLIVFFSHFGLSETYDDIHKDDGDYGEEEDEEANSKRQCKEKNEVRIARLTAIYLLFGYVLSVLVDKPQDVNIVIIAITMVVLSVVLILPVILLYYTCKRKQGGKNE